MVSIWLTQVTRNIPARRTVYVTLPWRPNSATFPTRKSPEWFSLVTYR